MSGALQTEFAFTLPQGFADEDGTLQREGRMRLATAADEILPLKDPRVRANPSYLTVILLSRVVVSLGTLEDVTPNTIESLFVSDIAYLQDLYERVNDRGADTLDATCPGCGETFEVAIGDAGRTDTGIPADTDTPTDAGSPAGTDAPVDARDDAAAAATSSPTIPDDPDGDGGESGNDQRGAPWD